METENVWLLITYDDGDIQVSIHRTEESAKKELAGFIEWIEGYYGKEVFDSKDEFSFTARDGELFGNIQQETICD